MQKRRRRRRPRPPRPANRPRPQYGHEASLYDGPPDFDSDPELWRVREALLLADITTALPIVIRETLDQIYDGQHTGRWDYDQLNKTEKTHIGTLIQINLHKELELEDGAHLDYHVAGSDVDCKWSRMMYEWEIPLEMYSRGPQLALLIWGSDYTSRWAAGLLRIDDSVLRPVGRQRDKKRKINDEGRRRILWLGEGDLVQNTLLHLPEAKRERILGKKTGQQCVIELFFELNRVLVNRATVLTVAQQDDSMKRVRDARKHLRDRGVVIFGHYKPHPELAEQLSLPRPTLGRFVSARLAPATESDDTLSVEIQGRRWRLADDGDEVTAAPSLPQQGQEAE